MPKISVIVPVYNTEQYLPRCIDSILAQTFTDFELLLIDDGSKDNSGKICDEYAAKDSRIRVYHKENGGVSSARNLGLDNALGEWIIFVDSDDWVENALWHNSYSSEVELIITSFIDIRKRNETILDSRIYKKDELSQYLGSKVGDDIFRGPVAKLFKKAIINSTHLRFCNDIHLGEDTLFVRQYILQVESLQLSRTGFYVVSEVSSLSDSLITVENAIYTIDLLCDSLELLERNKRVIVNNVKLNDTRFFFIRALKSIAIEKKNIKKKKDELNELIRNRNIQALLSDTQHIHKGARRRIFDIIARHKLIMLLVLYINIYQYD